VRRRIGKRYSAEVYAQACEWFVEFRAAEADEAVRQAFHSWLHQAPAHMAAYLDVAASWNLTGSLDVSARFPREALIAQGGDAHNLILYPGAAAPEKPLPPRRMDARLLSTAGLAATAGALALVAAVLVTVWFRGSSTFSTGIGQKRLIRLSDGSTIDLNARSRIIVRYTKTRREIDLLRGQALFADTDDPNRPFIVRSPATVVRAMGTQFDVNLLDAETIVTVIQGKVVVARQPPAPGGAADPLRPTRRRADSARATVYLTAGEQLTVSPTRRMRPVRTNVTAAIAWVHHKLIFASTALRDVVQEFNRYNARQLVIASPSLETFRIDGVFSSTNPKSLIDFLRQSPGIKVTETGNDVVISQQ
jgi:transmembrane sensor